MKRCKEGDVVKTTAADQKIIFPHIDSCVAIIAQLDDSSVVAAHVVLNWTHFKEGPQAEKNLYQGSAVDICDGMNKDVNIGSANVTHLMLVGELQWLAHMDKIKEKLNAQAATYLFVELGFGFQKTVRDVFLDAQANYYTVLVRNANVDDDHADDTTGQERPNARGTWPLVAANIDVSHKRKIV